MKAALVIALTLVSAVCELLVEAVSGETLAEFPDVDSDEGSPLHDALVCEAMERAEGWLQ